MSDQDRWIVIRRDNGPYRVVKEGTHVECLDYFDAEYARVDPPGDWLRLYVRRWPPLPGEVEKDALTDE